MSLTGVFRLLVIGSAFAAEKGVASGMVCPRCRAKNDAEAKKCRSCGKGLDVAMLQIVEGDLPENAYLLKPRTYHLGRAPDNDVVLSDPSISRHHARIVWEQSGFAIEDLKSRHGVFVDASRVSKAGLLAAHVLQLGSVVMRFRPLDPEGSTAKVFVSPAERVAALAKSRSAPAGAMQALDRLQMGVVLVAADGAVIFVNRSARAILDERDGLILDQRSLRATDSTVRRGLLPLLGEPGSPGGALLVPRNARRPLSVLVTPLGSEAGRLSAVKAVFISDPERGVDTGEQSLQRLYGLTPAESRLAGELLQGKSLEQASDELAITPNTARGHLKSIFAKTETRRQSELVRLLLSGPALVRRD